jgi:hypothetical protein
VFYAVIVFVAFLSDDENGINWKTEIAEYVMHVKLKSLAYTSTATPCMDRTYYDLSSLLTIFELFSWCQRLRKIT